MATSVSITPDVGLPAARVEAFKYLYESGCFTDLTITCRGREWKVHKTCILTLGHFFKAALTHDFKEAQESRIDLTDDDPDLVDGLIRYCYLFKYPEPPENSACTPMVWDVRISVIADKYAIDSLRDLALQALQKHAATGWATQDFADAASEIYALQLKGNHDFRIIVVKTVMAHPDLLCGKGTTGVFRRMLQERDELAADLCYTLSSRLRKQES